MKFTLSFLAFLASSAVASPIYQNLQLREGGDVNTLLQGLRDANLTSLADVLNDHPAVTEKILADNSEKYFLAPTNSAIEKLPQWVTSNSSRLEATLLQHVLRGNFDPNTFNAYPLHTIGHSLMNETAFSDLPGGAGQAVALSKSVNGSFVAEAVNNGTFVGNSTKVESITVQPIDHAITVPGSISDTLVFLGHNPLVQVIQNVQNGALLRTLDSMSGVTLFLPNNDAIEKFVATQPNANDLPTILGQHVVASRVLYSPLLIDQGSMISTSGQDIVFDNAKGSVTVGNYTAKILQTDIIAEQGVIHRIDTVLASTAFDANRAAEAAASAKASIDAAKAQSIAGPVSGTNSITTQGNSVPASQNGDNANKQANANGSSGGTGQTSTGVRNGADGTSGGAPGTGAGLGSSASTISMNNGTNSSSGINHRNESGNGAASAGHRISLVGSAIVAGAVFALLA